MIKETQPQLVQIASALSINPKWLAALINFESSGNPLARAKYPYNKAKSDKGLEPPKYARGLIQFIDPTAQSLGYLSADDLVEKNPDIASQLLFPVRQYLEQYKPFPTEQSLYMAVFYPAARNWPPMQSFPDSVKAANPGIQTPADYVRKVRGKGNSGIVVLAALAGFLLLKKMKVL